MVDLATNLAAEKKVEAGFMEPIVRKGHEALDDRRLRQYMDRSERHPQLQAVMAFFAAGLGPAALLDQLETEERRDRRKLLLDLLVVHGAAARAMARARVEASVGTPASDFARRNWIHLLRLVPSPAGGSSDGEIDVVARFASPGNPAFLAKEALTHLARPPRAGGDRLVSSSTPGRRSSSGRTRTRRRARRPSPPSTVSPPPSRGRRVPRPGGPSSSTRSPPLPRSEASRHAWPSWAPATSPPARTWWRRS
jgi:hypothetical protein